MSGTLLTGEKKIREKDKRHHGLIAAFREGLIAAFREGPTRLGPAS
jgi:hypothetical protein